MFLNMLIETITRDFFNCRLRAYMTVCDKLKQKRRKSYLKTVKVDHQVQTFDSWFVMCQLSNFLLL